MTETLLTVKAAALSVARLLAAELDTPCPATGILKGHLRKRAGDAASLRLHVTGPDPHPGTRQLTPAEKFRLGAPGLAQCCWRTGLLLYGLNDIAAVTTLTWLPARLSVEACVALAHGAAPAGKALTSMRRKDRRATVLHPDDARDADGLDIAVKSSAVLVVDGWAALIATERIPRAFTEYLAGAAAVDSA